MPLIKSAIKKVRSDKKKTANNRPVASSMRNALKRAKSDPSNDKISKAYSAIDRAAKKGAIKANTAGRLKSRLVKGTKVSGKSPFGKISTVNKTQAKAKKSVSKKSGK